MKEYVPIEEFNDFNKNFQTLITTFNHSITEIKEDVAEIRGTLKVSIKILYWLLGIIGAIIATAFLSIIK